MTNSMADTHAVWGKGKPKIEKGPQNMKTQSDAQNKSLKQEVTCQCGEAWIVLA